MFEPRGSGAVLVEGAGGWPEPSSVAGGFVWADVVEGSEPACGVPEDQWESYRAGDPDRWLVPPWEGCGPVRRGADPLVGAAVGQLHREPGVALVAAVQDVLTGSAVGGLSDDELVGVVIAVHRLVGWATTVRAEAARAVADRWTIHDHLGRSLPGSGGSARAGRLALVRRRAVRVWRRSAGRGAADQGRHVSEAGELGRAYAVAELSLACATSQHAVRGWLDAADALADPDRLPEAAAAAAAGLLDPGKLREIQRLTAPLPLEVAQHVDALVTHRTTLPAPQPPLSGADPVTVVELRTLPDLRDALHAAILAIDPAGAGDRARHARRTRSIVSERYDEIMARLTVTLPIETAARIMTMLQTRADHAQAAGDHRSIRHLKVDILTDLLLTNPHPDTHDADQVRAWFTDHYDDVASHHDEVTGHHVDPVTGEIQNPVDRPRGRAGPRVRCEVLVTVPLDTLLGRSNDPGHLTGFGPIAADQARTMIEDLGTHAVWRCAAVTDDHNTLLGLGTRTYTPRYTPGTALRRLTDRLHRDRCAFPTCTTRAAHCDWDHVTPHPHGDTCSCNGIPLCRRCHRLKTTGLIDVRILNHPTTGTTDHPPGTLLWTTATGRRHLHQPPPQVPHTHGQLIHAAQTTSPEPDDPIPF